MIQCLFEICIDMFNCFHKSQYVGFELLKESDYAILKEDCKILASEITDKIFKD